MLRCARAQDSQEKGIVSCSSPWQTHVQYVPSALADAIGKWEEEFFCTSIETCYVLSPHAVPISVCFYKFFDLVLNLLNLIPRRCILIKKMCLRLLCEYRHSNDLMRRMDKLFLRMG